MVNFKTEILEKNVLNVICQLTDNYLLITEIKAPQTASKTEHHSP